MPVYSSHAPLRFNPGAVVEYNSTAAGRTAYVFRGRVVCRLGVTHYLIDDHPWRAPRPIPAERLRYAANQCWERPECAA